ncbi:hypothetical protein Tco_0645813 [Tanacetum coccineum]
MSRSSSSSHGFRRHVNNNLCTCKLKVRSGRELCDTWNWFDPELEHDWHRYQLFDTYNLLNPHERHQHQAEMMR